MQLDKKRICAELEIDEALYNELLHDFLGQTDELMAKIDLEKRWISPDEIMKAAHFIKGAAANLRIEDIREIAQKIELACKEKKDIYLIKEDMARLIKAIDEFRHNI